MSFRGLRSPARACAVSMLVAASALANDPIVWDNGDAFGAAQISQLDTLYPFNAQVAADFRLRDQNPAAADDIIVSGVQWVGTYWRGYPNNPNMGFNMIFYADAGGTPTGGPDDPTDTALLNQFIPIEDANETPNKGGTNRFDYDVKLTMPFAADPDATYWLAIQANMWALPLWGWQRTTEVLGHEAQFGWPINGQAYWEPAGGGTPADQAFSLTGVEVPEPATALTLLAGGCLVGRRRRKCRKHPGG